MPTEETHAMTRRAFRIYYGASAPIDIIADRWEHDGTTFRLIDATGSIVLSLPASLCESVGAHIAISP